MLRKGSYVPHICKYLLFMLSHYILKFLWVLRMVKKLLKLTAALKGGLLSVLATDLLGYKVNAMCLQAKEVVH